MKQKLKTKMGKAVYAARKCVVEPVFGQIKQARGFRQFLLRGKEKVKCVWALLCLTHNVLRSTQPCSADEERQGMIFDQNRASQRSSIKITCRLDHSGGPAKISCYASVQTPNASGHITRTGS